MELHPHRVHFRSLIITFFLGICVIVIGVVYRYQENGYFVPSSTSNTATTKTPPVASPTPKAAVQQDPTQNVIVKNSAQTADLGDRFVIQADAAGKVGDLINIVLIGTSDGKKPVGYDALISISGGTYDVVSVKSLTTEFNVIMFAKSGRVTVTGVLVPRVKESAVWNSKEIASITIKPKEAGQYKLNVLESSGRETSKIMVKYENGQSLKLTSTTSESVLVDITN